MNENAFYEDKIKKILETVIQCQEKIDYNRLELLLQKLVEKENGGFGISPFDSPLFQGWLMETVNLLENSLYPTKQVIRFILNLTAILSRDEGKFVILNGNNVYSRIITLFQLRTDETFQVEYIHLLKNFTLHRRGLECLLYTGLWEDIFNKSFCADVEVSLKSCECMAWFVEKIATSNEKLCIDIISKTMTPFHKFDLTPLTTDPKQFAILENAIYESLRPTLLLICKVFKHLLESPNLVSNLRIVLIFTKDFQLETYIKQLMESAENKDFIFDLSKISFLIQFFELCIKAKDTTYHGDAQMITKNIMDICKKNILRNNVDKMLQFCHFGLKFWKKVTKQIPEIISNCDKEHSIEHQLVTLEILPLYLIPYQFVKCSDIADVLDTDDARLLYANKVCKPLSEPTLRLAFLWRNIVTDHNYCFEEATKALSFVMESKNNYDRYHAIIIFQALIYTLKDICHLMSEQPSIADSFVKEEAFLILLLDCLANFIEEFSITWKESVESICAVSITINFLSLHNWKDEIAVKGLKLMHIAIEKYMAPNLALLIDRICESSLAMIGSLLYSKLQESTWEVRASALQVLCIICNLADSKFPSFQKCVLDNGLPHLVLKIAIHDGESSVRAKAFQCLTEMIRIDEFWKNLINKFHDLNHCFIQALHNECDGFVRKEITTTIRETYSNHRLHNKSLMLLYETMMTASADIQWEVKMEALKFWDLVIKNHLQEQGMIDGAFPAVTFSKENRKIITLTKNEIFKRLYIVLTQLSQTGCLTVLMTAIQDKCHLEVLKLAVTITQALVNMLNKYNINSDSIRAMHCITSLHMGNNIPSPDPFSPGIKFSSTNGSKSPDQVIQDINSIFNGQDIDLSLYSNKQKLPGNKQLISPAEFLDFSQQDFDSLINERKKWLKGCDELELLLDKILKGQELECHKMDCC